MDKFETWWESEGQEFLYALNTTTDDDIKLVAEVAWKNGAYCAEPAEQEPVACIIHTEEGDYLDWNSKGYCFYTGETPLYAAPVRTKDLTDDEIREAYSYGYMNGTTSSIVSGLRAVIAADREKNNANNNS